MRQNEWEINKLGLLRERGGAEVLNERSRPEESCGS